VDETSESQKLRGRVVVSEVSFFQLNVPCVQVRILRLETIAVDLYNKGAKVWERIGMLRHVSEPTLEIMGPGTANAG